MRTASVEAESLGELADFEGFFRAHYAGLVRTLYLISGDPRTAEDLAQEALIQVCVRWERVRRMSSPQGYLYRVALNLSKSTGRGPKLSLVPLAEARDTEAEPERSSLQLDLHRALQGLPDRQRIAFVVVEWLGMGSQEASELLGTSPASVRTLVFRARRALRKELVEWLSDGGERDD